jgi:hypothetical protein
MLISIEYCSPRLPKELWLSCSIDKKKVEIAFFDLMRGAKCVGSFLIFGTFASIAESREALSDRNVYHYSSCAPAEPRGASEPLHGGRRFLSTL